MSNQIYLNIEKPGLHEIQFSMREDGFEFDKFILTTNVDYKPKEEGPEPIVAQGILPTPFPKAEAPYIAQ